MTRRGCEGWVHGLKGQTICFTGKIVLDGERMVRAECARRARQRGATTKTDFSGGISLVVHGDLTGKQVSDQRRNYSDTLVAAERERELGHHVHVVDGAGFGELIHGLSARCLELRRPRRGGGPVVVPASATYDVLGAPLTARKVTQHGARELTVDLDALDEGTAAHESTIGALIEHLAHRHVEVHTFTRNSPRFDAGWAVGKELFVAEVKSLTGTSQDQQIRLGIGQVLDYAHQLRSMASGWSIRPVLVLEKQPADDRWTSLAEAIGIQLTWAPGFQGV
ncbi:hypothetical protein FNH04_24360 [Streptomyces phyllanthi]|uniref:Uncharacterized protein n=1 Tax=Streptomyces phyllanthi TaxID=1803180 RepID=A0A5N8W9W7_9ACTN|nr:hypothetical protein [Streptomyces phyllanthi]MPY42925.1 hypothetical protein [Streptomyces phyllanthi]